MKFRFQAGINAKLPHRLADCEIVFEEHGVVLTGLTIWSRKDGAPGVYVTFPAQRLKDGADAKYLDFVRSADEAGQGAKKLKQAITDAFRKEHPEVAGKGQAVSPAKSAPPVKQAPAAKPAPTVADNEDYGY